MEPMVRRKLGRTNIELTQLGLGGAGLGDLFDVVEDTDASATLLAAWDAGIRYYDTSPWYGRGQSEHRFGRALYRRPRADYVLSTKVGRLFRAFHEEEKFEHGFWRGGLKFQHRFDYSHGGYLPRLYRVAHPDRPEHPETGQAGRDVAGAEHTRGPMS